MILDDIDLAVYNELGNNIDDSNYASVTTPRAYQDARSAYGRLPAHGGDGEGGSGSEGGSEGGSEDGSEVGSLPRASDNPAMIGYPSTLPLEIALNTAPVSDILEAYGISDMEWEYLRFEPTFVLAVKNAQEALAKDGMSFKLKARLQAEELLKTTWSLIHNPNVSPQVRADLIKSTVRWAGYDNPEQALGAGSGFSININLGNPPGRLIEQ